MQEQWIDIPGYEGEYKVSNKYNIMSLKNNKEKIMKLSSSRGYLEVTLKKNGKATKINVDKLVARIFGVYKKVEDLQGEVWKEIKGYEKLYIVSNLGRVKSLYGETETLLDVSRNGITLYKNGKRKYFTISKLVGDMFGYKKVEDLQDEVWKEIKGYEKLYMISNMGRVKALNYRNTGGEEILKASERNGYLKVDLCKNNRTKSKSVHTLVAEAFCEGYEEGKIVNHINEIKTDNRACNLEWVTYQENSSHSAYKVSQGVKESIINKQNKNFILNDDKIQDLEGDSLKCIKEDLIDEIWKDVKGYEGLYQVSNMGRIISLNYRNSGKKYIMTCSETGGYLSVVLSKGGNSKSKSIHRLVAEAFCEGYKEGKIVNHINEIKTDNRACNLEWITYQENSLHSAHKVSESLKKNSKNKKKIRCIEKDRIFESITKASQIFECTIGCISKCLRGINQTACGYHWEYYG